MQVKTNKLGSHALIYIEVSLYRSVIPTVYIYIYIFFKYANKKIQAELKGGALVQKSINNVSNFVQSPSSTCNYG